MTLKYMQPDISLPFLVAGRLARIKQGNLEWGWGVVIICEENRSSTPGARRQPQQPQQKQDDSDKRSGYTVQMLLPCITTPEASNGSAPYKVQPTEPLPARRRPPPLPRHQLPLPLPHHQLAASCCFLLLHWHHQSAQELSLLFLHLCLVKALLCQLSVLHPLSSSCTCRSPSPPPLPPLPIPPFQTP